MIHLVSDPLEAIQADLHQIKIEQQKTNKHLSEINGTVARHNEEIFGNNATQGLVPRVRQNEEYIIQVKAVTRAIVALMAIVGVTNIIMIFRSGPG